MKNRQGFTLIEMLITLTVLGILLGIGFTSLLSYQRNVLLRETAAQLYTDLNDARNQSRRTSQNWEVIVAADNKGYTFGQVGAASPVSRKLSPPAVFGTATNANILTFNAPYGVVNVGSDTFSIEAFDRSVEVNVVGVTGKVVIKNVTP